MRTLAISAVLLLAPLTAVRCADPAEKVDLQRIYDHFHKTWSTPPSTKLQITGLKPSPVPSLLAGTLVIEDAGQKQSVPILVTTDGRDYILSDLFETERSSIPAFRSPFAGKDQPPPPPIHVTDDGRYVALGDLQHASVDPEQEALSKMDLKSVPSTGPANAPITLVEYSDLECPYCEQAHALLVSDVLPAYPGKVRWVFKNFPLQGIHPWSYDAALAAACVGKLKPAVYIAFITAMFHRQKEITPENLREKLVKTAKEAGVDEARFAPCWDKKESKPLVDAQIREGESLGLTGTPSLFVNGRRLRSYQPAAVRRIIDEKLAGK